MSEKEARSVSAVCPDCGRAIQIKSPVRMGQEIACPHCDAELEVIETDPVELDWIYEDDVYEDEDEEEDW
jgi:lysine biosynthesis protein LysW